MDFATWVLFGFLAGAVAKLLMPGRDPGGWKVTILLGIAGAFIGGFVGRAIWGTGIAGTDLRSFGLAVLGAIVLLFLHRMIQRRRKPTDAGSNRRAA
jgi:uncharacterized membrane protein YeaQ/YmgE (transglycosylase-associated protein family)